MQIYIKTCCLKIHQKQSIIAVNNPHFREINNSKNVCVCFLYLLTKQFSIQKWKIDPNSKTTPYNI